MPIALKVNLMNWSTTEQNRNKKERDKMTRTILLPQKYMYDNLYNNLKTQNTVLQGISLPDFPLLFLVEFYQHRILKKTP